MVLEAAAEAVGGLNTENLVCDIRLSTVVPASITGEDKDHHLSSMDLSLKLHYITSVHFFGGDAAEGLSIHDFKKPMFEWLQLYYPICGRLRRHDGGGGRPYVKCNDSGVRIVEATCARTVAEWLATVNGGDHHRLLVYNQPLLAHDFGFTPLVILQITKFKCGGVCVGMRWAHILGDAFSASKCINMWGKIMANQTLPPQLLPTPTIHGHYLNRNPSSFRSVKQLEPLGDNWLSLNNSKMQMHTFHLSEKQLSNLLSGERKKIHKIAPFDVISAIVWKSVAKISGTDIVTVCKKREFDGRSLETELPGNGHQVIGTVEAQTIIEADPLDIAELIAEKFVDETSAVEKKMEEGGGNLDFLVYGSKLTFVNLEEVDLYGLQMKGKGPVFANISVGEVGDEGAVVVVPDSSGDGRVVNVILPEHQLQHLKNELSVEWSIF